MSDEQRFDKKRRESLFLELAGRPGGVTPRAIYEAAVARGDQATEEAYYNLARRLEHRGLIIAVDEGRPKKYIIGQAVDAQWLEEEDLAELVSDEYPLLTLPIWREAKRQINEVPEELWIELRERLASENAQQLFVKAIQSYCADLDAAFKLLQHELDLEGAHQEIARLKEDVRGNLQLLQMLVRHGLGISNEAVRLPLSLEVGLEKARPGEDVVKVDIDTLKDEISRRVLDEPFVCEVDAHPERNYLMAAVDGSTLGGMMFSGGPDSDFLVGHSPMVTVNTCVGQINRSIRVDGRTFPAFMRLPEKPEDMQRSDNRYTFMAKLFYPDLSDAKYMHSVWNAMDALESRVALRMLSRWATPEGNVEVPPADVVLRDGTVSPQDRDFAHYRELTTYGRIVRDSIESNWEIAKKCRDDSHTVGGVVKGAQLRIFGPVLSWYAAQVAAREKRSLLATWPMRTLNLVPDQVLLTRLLTAGRRRNDTPVRTCVVIRPFQALTDRGGSYSRNKTATEVILGMHKAAVDNAASGVGLDEQVLFWRDFFRGAADPYFQMLGNVWYGSFFLSAVPRLDAERYLPRIEILVPESTSESGTKPLETASIHLKRLLEALQLQGFEVSLEHSMFRDRSYVEILPVLLIKVHETVKIWAQELMSRVQEYVGTVLSHYVQGKRMRNLRVRPFSRDELKVLLSELRSSRNRLAGSHDQEGRIKG